MKRGFTLIELMIVVAIIAIIAAIVLPALGYCGGDPKCEARQAQNAKQREKANDEVRK